MGKFNPEQYRVKVASNGKLDLEQYRVGASDSESGPSVGTTAVRQGIQAMSGGLSDEFAGGVEAAGRVVGLNGLGGPMKNISINDDGPTISGSELLNSYKKGRDIERGSLKEDQETNPGTTLAANIVGGIASPINKIAKGVGAVKAGATLGGVYGFGTSEADNVADIALDTGKGVVAGAAIGKVADKIGKAVAPTAASLAEKIRPAASKINKSEIMSAADRLGIKVTPGMLDDSGFVERLESSLAKSPGYLGQRVAEKQKAVTNALRDAVEESTKDATNLGPYQIGDKFKSGITAKVGERLDPISTVFDEVAQSTKFIPVSDRSKNAIINNITKLDSYTLTNGAGKPAQYVDMIGRIQNADQVKTVMTMLNADIKAAMGAEKQVLIAMKNKLGTLEENSITRSAIQQARDGGMRKTTGENIGKDIVGDLRGARTGYRELVGDLSELAENTRIKTNKGPSSFLDSVEEIPNERIQDKFFNVENNRSLINLKEKFPEQFDLLRQGKLKDIADASVDNSLNGQGKISAQKFLNEVRKLNPEAKEALFKDSVGRVGDIETVQKSLPKNFNPSGTASEATWQNAIYSNVKDIPNYLLYKGASSNLGKKIGSAVSDSSLDGIRDVSASAVKKITNPASRLSGAEVATKLPVKGFEKFANDGADKIIEHDPEFDSALLERVKKSKKGRDLLIRASDLKPGSKAMDKLFGEIKEEAY